MDLVREMHDPAAASKLLVDHALSRFSTDNLSCMIVRFDKTALADTQKGKALGVEGDSTDQGSGKVSEAEKIVCSTKQKIAEGGTPAVGVSASNSGRGHDPEPPNESGKPSEAPTTLDPTVEEEPPSRAPDEDRNAHEVDKEAVPAVISKVEPATQESVEKSKDLEALEK